MAKPKRENATEKVRLFPSTHRRLRLRSVRTKLTIAQLVDKLERESQQKTV